MKLEYLFYKAFAADSGVNLRTSTFKGPAENLSSALAYVNTISAVALDIAAILGIIMIFYAAFMYVSSFGEEAKAETAKKTLMWAAIGTFVVVIARLAIRILGNMLG